MVTDKEAQRLIRIIKSKYERQKENRSQKNNVEIISNNEIYLLDADNNRLYPICGYLYRSKERCCKLAGYGTTHTGSGRCYKHEKKRENSRLIRNKTYWEKLFERFKENDSQIIYSIIKSSELTVEELYDIDNILIFLRGMLNELLITQANTWGSRQRSEALSIAKEIANIIDRRNKFETEKNVRTAISQFISLQIPIAQSVMTDKQFDKFIQLTKNNLNKISQITTIEDIDFTEVE